MYREGVARVLAQRPEFEVVAEVDDGRGGRRRDPPPAARRRGARPAAAGLDGVSAAAALEREGSSTKVVILSAFEDSATVYRAIASGARAYLQKVVSGETLCRTILAVARGETVIPPALQGRSPARSAPARERADDPC